LYGTFFLPVPSLIVVVVVGHLEAEGMATGLI